MNTEVVRHSLLQGLFPKQSLNPQSCIAGQFFTVLRGEGRTGVYGEKARVVKPGDVVICPAGVKHFHGAGPDTQMVQMTVTGDHPEGKGVTWLEEVTDEQYNKIEK